jgi:hypothetical protein
MQFTKETPSQVSIYNYVGFSNLSPPYLTVIITPPYLTVIMTPPYLTAIITPSYLTALSTYCTTFCRKT